MRERTGLRAAVGVRLLSTDGRARPVPDPDDEPGARRWPTRTGWPSELEEELRQRIADIADVVVHTEP